MKQTEISRATMGRLPGYLNYLRSLSKETRFISSTAIAKELELGEVQVRKDLSAVCGAGKPKVGYDVSALAESLETTLGTHSKGEAIIVGAGKLGLALLGFGGFSEYGVKISHAFDNDPSKFSASVLPIGELPRYCKQHKIEIGIIAAPVRSRSADSRVADKQRHQSNMELFNRKASGSEKCDSAIRKSRTVARTSSSKGQGK